MIWVCLHWPWQQFRHTSKRSTHKEQKKCFVNGFLDTYDEQMTSSLLAPLLLLLALTLLALAEFMGASAGAGMWPWVKAGAEAAAVGALADWFAVTVLFRHPLGIKLPHTAIVPANKARIADSLAEFVRTHFLQRDKLLAKLAQFNVAGQLACWLQQAMQVQRFVQGARQVLLDTVRTLDDAAAQHALTEGLTAQALRWNAASTLGQALDLVTQDNRHQQVLDMGLEKLSAALGTPKVRAFVGEQINAFLKKDYPKLHFMLDTVTSSAELSESVAGKLRDAVIDYLQAILHDPQHPQREDFSAMVRQYLDGLHHDAALQRDFNAAKDRLVQSPEVRAFVGTVWADVKARLMDDLACEDSALARHAQAGLQALGERLARDEGLRDTVNRYFEQVAGELADQLARGIPKHIADTIKAWDDQQLVTELERNVGRDLQFIRINGTLVGALVGLGFHALQTLWLG